MADNIDILVKLFETLQASTDKSSEATNQLIVQQLELVNQIKNLPVEDLKVALKEHAKDSAQNISNSQSHLSGLSDVIMKELRVINAKITKMIIIFSVIITVSTGGYFVIRTVADSDQYIEEHLDGKFENLSNQISKEREDRIKTLKEELQDLSNSNRNVQ